MLGPPTGVRRTTLIQIPDPDPCPAQALRQFQFRVGACNFCVVHVSLVPVLGAVGEQKTKPTQHSVAVLRSLGLNPALLVCRSSDPLQQSVREKLVRGDRPEPCITFPANCGILTAPVRAASCKMPPYGCLCAASCVRPCRQFALNTVYVLRQSHVCLQALFCQVQPQNVLTMHDVSNIWQVCALPPAPLQTYTVLDKRPDFLHVKTMPNGVHLEGMVMRATQTTRFAPCVSFRCIYSPPARFLLTPNTLPPTLSLTLSPTPLRQVPLLMAEQGSHTTLCSALGLAGADCLDLREWKTQIADRWDAISADPVRWASRRLQGSVHVAEACGIARLLPTVAAKGLAF